MDRVFFLEPSMSRHKHKWGFCLNCLRNVPHYREFRIAPLRFLDALSFRILSVFRIGPWYCVHCERKAIFLGGERSDAPQFRPPFAAAENQPVETTRDAHSKPPAELVGNFLKEEESLVMRATRLKKYSEKYRDSIVRRIMSGSATMMQIRQEKNLSEGELLDWIADLFRRMQSKMDTQTSMLEAFPHLRFLDDHARTNGPTIPEGTTIEGKVKPK